MRSCGFTDSAPEIDVVVFILFMKLLIFEVLLTFEEDEPGTTVLLFTEVFPIVDWLVDGFTMLD
jgi:hypothetical protein